MALDKNIKSPIFFKKLKASRPFVSIHIPVCNEPPEMVIQTITSCINQNYKNYEIIVLCNNTSNIQLWHPIADFCLKHPALIKFKHYKKLKGYKAGALDVCRNLTDLKATYIFTVDADYRLDRNAIKTAVRYATAARVHLLQFPQSYVQDIKLNNSALQDELYSYFEIFSNIGNRQNAALPTGTLSLLKITALDAVGGWQAKSITEDAELGLKFIHKGYKTYFASKTIGKGQLPNAISDLYKQRYRWVFGNVQTLFHGLGSGLLDRNSALGTILQLTAWLNFLALPSIVLVLKVLFLILSLSAPGAVFYVSLACIALYLVEQFLLLGISTDFKKGKWVEAFFVRVALTSVGAFGWLSALLALQRPFVCTNKFRKKTNLWDIPYFLPLIFLVIGVALFMRGYPIAYAFLLLHLLFMTASLVLYKQFRYVTKPGRAQLQNV